MTDKKRSKYLTKKVKFGGKDMTLYSLDGNTWSSRKDELHEILERHENEKITFGQIKGGTSGKRPLQKPEDDGEDAQDVEIETEEEPKKPVVEAKAKSQVKVKAPAKKPAAKAKTKTKSKAKAKSKTKTKAKASVSPKKRTSSKKTTAKKSAKSKKVA